MGRTVAEDLADAAKAGVKFNRIADVAGVDRATLRRILEGADTKESTALAIRKAITQIRDELAAIPGIGK